jgi:hypothetical protein
MLFEDPLTTAREIDAFDEASSEMPELISCGGLQCVNDFLFIAPHISRHWSCLLESIVPAK